MMKTDENKLQTRGLIQSGLQNLNTKFQNTKIGTTIYSNESLLFSTMYICSIIGGEQV